MAFLRFYSTLLILLFTLSACIDLQLSPPDLVVTGSTNTSFIANQFKETCLNSRGKTNSLRTSLPSLGWADADDIQLVEGGLRKLRKVVLKIPGGGGHYSQTQTLHIKEDKAHVYYLNLEERFTKKVKSGTHCALYSSAAEYLKTCSDIGKYLGRAPDRNQKYPSGKAQFIGWTLSIEGKRSVISCEKTPITGTLPYHGIVISLTVQN